jgi:hypothetical protein
VAGSRGRGAEQTVVGGVDCGGCLRQPDRQC